MNKKRTFVAVIVALVVTVGLLTVGWIGSNAAMSSYAGQLEGGYKRSFSELVTNINNVEINLSKALITQDIEKQKELYQKINQQCTLCATNLSNLPINHESIVETTKFVNQLGGFSYYLNKKLNSGDKLSDSDNSSVNDLYNWAVYIQTVINDYANNLKGDFSILESTHSGNTTSDFDKMFANTSATGTEYPTLIYDGPFSDSKKNKTTNGLKGEEITEKQARDKVAEVFKEYNVSNLIYTGEFKGVFSGYNYSFDTTNKHYYVQIAKKGAFLLSASSSGNTKQATKTLLEAEKSAENFAKTLGLKELKSVWSTTLGGVAYVNLAPVIDKVIIYPDLIKVKVSLDSASILGWEAESYAFNNTERKNLKPLVGATDAKKMVSPKMNVLSANLAIIPQDYGNEILCYEYKCTLNNYTYYIYVSAENGKEVETLRVIKTSNGNLLE